MAKETPDTQAGQAVPAGFYQNDVPDHLVSAGGDWRLVIHDDGTVEIRHAGSHDRYL